VGKGREKKTDSREGNHRLSGFRKFLKLSVIAKNEKKSPEQNGGKSYRKGEGNAGIAAEEEDPRSDV